MSELEQDDFSELESEGLFAYIPLKALGCKEAQALVSNIGAVRARAEKVLPSSSTTRSRLEALTAMALPAMSSQNVEAKDSATEPGSESNAEEGGHVSENDLEITGEPSHTVEEPGKTNRHFGSM